MDHERIIDFLWEAMILKRTPRTGWQRRGVSHVESVAEHSFGTALVALVLTEALRKGSGEALDREKVLLMALLHDLAEARLTDLPMSALCLIPEEVKSQAEAIALADLLNPLSSAEELKGLWQEFEDRTSPEGQLVRDADKLEMMVQCLRYEWAGSRGLDEFWQVMDRHQWHYTLSADLYARLKAKRAQLYGHCE